MPRYRTALRQATATHLGHHKGRLLDSTYDLHSNKYQDPADQVLIQHIKAVHQWPPEQMTHLEQAWSQLHDQLQTKQHPWYTVSGPLAASWNWQVGQLHRWTRPATQILQDNDLSLQDPWWKVERTLLQEARHHKTARLTCSQALTGTHIGKRSNDSLLNHVPTSRHGYKEPSITKQQEPRSYALCAKCQPHPSTSFGCASGIKDNSKNQCPRNGQTGY